MLREQTFTRRKNIDLNGSLLQIQHATFLTQQWTGLPCFTQHVAALHNSSSIEYSRIHLPDDAFLLLEDKAAVPDCQSGCFVSRGRRPSCLSSTPCSSTFCCVPTQVRKALTFPGSAESTDWYAEATCLLEKGLSQPPLLSQGSAASPQMLFLSCS